MRKKRNVPEFASVGIGVLADTGDDVLEVAGDVVEDLAEIALDTAEAVGELTVKTGRRVLRNPWLLVVGLLLIVAAVLIWRSRQDRHDDALA